METKMIPCMGVILAALGMVVTSPVWSMEKSSQSLEEMKAWRAVQNVMDQDRSLENVVRLLTRFRQAFPSGKHAADAVFTMAEVLFGEKRYGQALLNYQQLAQSDDYGEDALMRMGEIYYNTGKFQEAQKAWKRLLDKTSSKSALRVEGLYGLALCELKDGNFVDANKILDRIIGKFPAYHSLDKVRGLMGILRYQEKNYTEALETLKDIETPSASFYRGLSHLHQKHYLEAADSFQKSESGSSGNFAELAGYLKAESFRLADNDGLAVRAYGQFVERYPSSRFRPHAFTHIAEAQFRLGRHKEALESVLRAQNGDVPGELRAYTFHLGAEIAARKGEYRDAVGMLKQVSGSVRKDRPDLYGSMQIAQGYYMVLSGRAQEGTRMLQSLVQELPYHPLGIVAYTLIGNQAYHSKGWDQAVSAYQSALLKYRYSPLSDVAMAMMLSSFIKQRRYQDLVTNANRVMKIINSQFTAQSSLWRSYSNLALGEAYYQLGLFADASSHYEQAMAHEDLAQHGRIFLAWSKYHEGKYPDVIRLIGAFLKHADVPEKEQARAHLLMAASQFNQGSYDSAIEMFRDFRKRFPQDDRVADSWMHEGWAHRQAGFPGDALEAWRALANTFPSHPLAPEAQMLAARLQFQSGNFALAVRDTSQFLDRWPQSSLAPEAQWLMAQSFYNQRKDAQAIDAFENFLANYSKDLRVEEAKVNLQQARFRQAMGARDPQLLARFVELYPKSSLSPDAQYELCRALYEKKDWPRAIQEYRKLLLEYPGVSQAPLALLAVAHIQDKLSQWEEAIREYQSLLNLFPASAVAIDAAMRLGAIQFHRQKYGDSIRSFRFVLEHEAPADSKANALFNIAVSYKKDRNHPEALKHFEEFLKAYPSDTKQVDALLEVAVLHQTMEAPLRAVASYQEILQKPQVDAKIRLEIHHQLGEIYQKVGDRENAISSYGELLSMGPRNADLRLLGLAQLAALHEEKGDWEQAMKVYRSIRASGGREEWVKAAVLRMKEIRVHLRAQQQAKQQESKAAAEAVIVQAGL